MSRLNPRRPVSISRSKHQRTQISLTQLEDRSVPAAVPLGPQFTVAAVTGTEAGPPAVAVVDPAGDFVAAWESFETDGSGIGVYAQRFEADGDPIGTPVLVNTMMTAGNQSRPAIATDGAGHVVIAWQTESMSGGAYDICYRTGDAAIADPVNWFTSDCQMVNVATTGNQKNPTAAMDANGNFVIAWQTDQDFATTGLDIYARYGTYGGGLLGMADTPITTAAGDQRDPDAAMAVTAMDGSGEMVVAWTGVANPPAATVAVAAEPGGGGGGGGGEGSGGGGAGGGGEGEEEEAEEASIIIRGTVYTYNGAFDSVTPIDAAHTDYQLTSLLEAELQHDQVNPDVAMAPDGRFVLVWQAEGQQGSGSDIFSRRFDANGDGRDAGNVLVNTVTSQPQRNPAVGIDVSGDYFVAWQSQGADAKSWGIVGRAFNDGGTQTKADFIVNINEQGPQTEPAVAVAPNGSTVAVWGGPFVPSHGGTEGEEGVEGEGGHQPALFARLFNNTGTVDVTPSPTALNVNGLEFQLAAVGAGEDVPAAAAALTDGTFVVVWQAFEETEDPSGFGVYGQRIQADGTPIGSRFLVNTTTIGYQSHPSVAALPSGGFIVTWQGEVRGATMTDPSQYDIFARVFNVDPETRDLIPGTDFLVNENTTDGNQGAPAIASDDAGNLVIAWQTDAQDLTEDGKEIYARRYTTAGTVATALAPEFRVNTETATDQVSPKVAMNAAGQFAIVWVSDHNVVNDPDDTEKSIFVRWFDASVIDQATADLAAPEFIANVQKTKDAQEHPAIGIDAAGDIVVAWQSINQEPGGSGVSWGVFARQFAPKDAGPATPPGNPLQPEEFQVNETIAGPQRFPSVGVDAAGRFAIAWQSINQDGSSWGIYQRQYQADGDPDTGEEPVNTETQGPQIEPIYARFASGNYDIFWSGGLAEHIDGIGGRQYGINAVPSSPNMTGPSAVSGPERRPISLDGITITAADTDVFETLSIVISGVPNDATLSAGTLRPDGTWLLTPDQLAGLTITAAHEQQFTLTVTGIATEIKTGNQETTILPVMVTVLNVDFFAAGQGDGGIVRQYGLDTSLMREIDAFPGFTGGVHVATGDVTGDGVPDIVVGAGPGGGPHVKVFDGATGDLVRSFFAYDPSFTGGVMVAAGDIDGDGRAEIVTAPTAGGGPHIKVFDGATNAEVRSFFAYDPSFLNGASVAVGDVTGDGVADIVTGALAGGASHVKAFDGVTNAEVRSFFAFEPTFMGGVNVAVGNVVGDGRMDIIAGPGPGGGPRARIFDGHDLSSVTDIFAFDPAFRGGLRVGAIDQDGDGLSELLIGAGEGGGPAVQIVEPLTLDIAADFMAFDATSRGGVWVG